MPLMTINAPGTYFIDSDMTQPNPNDDAIRIAPGVHYVNIVLRGGRIVGAGGPGSTNAGIRAVGNAAVTVLGQGGSIRGFAYGLSFQNTLLARLTGIFVQDALFRGIMVAGDDAYISDNDIRNVQGATWTPNAYCMGIEVSGISALGGKPKVLRNTVQIVHGTGTGESVGISVTDKAFGALVIDNIVKNDIKPGLPFGGGASIGVWCGGASDVIAAQNTISVWDYGLVYSSPPTGVRGQNLYENCTTDFVDSGGDIVIGSED